MKIITEDLQRTIATRFKVYEDQPKDDALLVECPGIAQHTNANNPKDCSIFVTEANVPSIHCFHDSCAKDIADAKIMLRSLTVGNDKRTRTTMVKPAKVKLKGMRFQIQPHSLPEPIAKGNDATLLHLEACFQSDDMVFVCLMGDKIDRPAARRPEPAKQFLKHTQTYASVAQLKEWLQDGLIRDAVIKEHEMTPDYVEQNAGCLIAVNPLFANKKCDECVSQFNYMLVEFDKLPIDGQYSLIKSSGLPYKVAIGSGCRSLHFWVPVFAEDGDEYSVKANRVLEIFSAYAVDPQNKNPSRYSRLAGQPRLGVLAKDNSQLLVQEQCLYEVIDQPRSLDDWLEEMTERQMEKQAAKLPQLQNALSVKSDPNVQPLLISEYNKADILTPGDAWLICASQGAGKSIMDVQQNIHFALGQTCFDLFKPTRPLKVLSILTEDSAKVFQRNRDSILKQLGHCDRQLLIDNYIVQTRELPVPGMDADFLEYLRLRVVAERPDLVVINPLNGIFSDNQDSKRINMMFRDRLPKLMLQYQFATLIYHHLPKYILHAHRHELSMGQKQNAGAGNQDLFNAVRINMTLMPANNANEYWELYLGKTHENWGLGYNEDNRRVDTLYLRRDFAPNYYWWLASKQELETKKQESADEYQKAHAADVQRIADLLTSHADGLTTKEIKNLLDINDKERKRFERLLRILADGPFPYANKQYQLEVKRNGQNNVYRLIQRNASPETLFEL